MRSYAHVVAAATLGAGFVVLLELPGLNDLAILLLSNLGQLPVRLSPRSRAP